MTKKTMRRNVTGVFLIIIMGLAAILGQQLGVDAMAVVVGIIGGAVAAIPASIMFAVVERRLQERGRRFRRECRRLPVMLAKSMGIARFPRGDGDGHFCYPSPHPIHKKGVRTTSRDERHENANGPRIT